MPVLPAAYCEGSSTAALPQLRLEAWPSVDMWTVRERHWQLSIVLRLMRRNRGRAARGGCGRLSGAAAAATAPGSNSARSGGSGSSSSNTSTSANTRPQPTNHAIYRISAPAAQTRIRPPP